jgi:ubiquitin carboxyl-terminal hydrolase 9/13
MKIKRLPKVLALHLKRFKYTEDYSRLHKLFHRVVYPYHLRMFNTTDDAEDPDRMYELYAVVVHIGGNAYHGHYVAVIKTPDRGWLLFDDEMVEPVDKHFVRNFFGDKPGMACAYVLFYQETTFEKVREEQDAEGLEEVKLASEKADLALGNDQANGISTSPLSKLYTSPISPVEDHDPAMATLGHARTAPGVVPTSPEAEIDPPYPPPQSPPPFSHPLVAAPPPEPAVMTEADKAATVPPGPVPTGQEDAAVTKPHKTKEEKRREKEELKAQEKARKAAEKEAARLEAKEKAEREKREFHARQERTALLREMRRNDEEQLAKALQESKALAAEEEKRRKNKNGGTAAEETPKVGVGGILNRANRGSKSLSRKSFAFLGKEREKENKVADTGGHSSTPTETATKLNGTATAGPPVPPIPEDGKADKAERNDGKALKDRFSFSIGRKKSGKFTSSS